MHFDKLTMGYEKGATLHASGQWDEKMPTETSPLIERVPVAEPEERGKYGYKSNANARFRIIRRIGSCAKVRQIYLFKGFNNSAADSRVHD